MWTKPELRAALELGLIAGVFGGLLGYFSGKGTLFGGAAGLVLLAFSIALGTLVELVTSSGRPKADGG